MDIPELTFASAVRLGGLIRARQVSSLEVTEAHLRRIHGVNPQLNAVCHLAEETALQLARNAGAELARGTCRSPLHGVPFTVKDWIEVAEMPCMANEERYRNHVPTQHATVVERMISAGCVLLGKTTVTDDSPVYGRTNNPYRLEFSPGGSSSGEAAIIASGGSPLGLGSDSGGSIRDPAHFCGIAGLRPTTGRIPITGHLPRINTFVDPRTVIGPMARRVEDLAAALPILAGIDWQDPSVVPMSIEDWNKVNIRELRGAFYSHYPGATPSLDGGLIARKAAQYLQDTGLEISETIPACLIEAMGITQDYWSRSGSEGLEEDWMPDGDGRMSGVEVERHLFYWDRFRRSLIAFMKDFDFILTPVSDYPARAIGSEGGESYCIPYSLAGYPCVVVRAGTSSTGLPVGVQIVARPWREDVALAIAQRIEAYSGGWQAPFL
jgi:amidase